MSKQVDAILKVKRNLRKRAGQTKIVPQEVQVISSKQKTVSNKDKGTQVAQKINTMARANLSNGLNLVKEFDGEEEECQFFFTQLEEIADLCGWNEKEKGIILKTKLKGKAKEYLISDPTLLKANYAKIKEAFVQFFSNEDELNTKQIQFDNIKLRAGESVKTLAHRITIASNKYLGSSEEILNPETVKMLDKLRLSKFVSALNPQLQTEVLKVNPKTFNEALTIATNVQVAFDTVAKLQINNLLCREEQTNIRESELTTEITNLKEQVNNLRVNSGENNAMPINNILCLACGNNGHWMSNCQVYLNMQENSRGYANNNNNYRHQYGNQGYQNRNYYEGRGARRPQGARGWQGNRYRTGNDERPNTNLRAQDRNTGVQDRNPRAPDRNLREQDREIVQENSSNTENNFLGLERESAP